MAAPETVVLPEDELEPAAAPETVVLHEDDLEPGAAPETVLLPEDELAPAYGPETRPLSDVAPELEVPQAEMVSEPAPPDALRLCTTCGTPLAPDATFCLECGRTVSLAQEPPAAADATGVVDTCLSCGATLVPEAVFCPECGQPRATSAVGNGSSVAPGDG
jgi:ribosomal protein L40E